MIDDLIEQCISIVDIEIKNSTINNDAIINNKSYESSNNTYFILFIVFLVLFILILGAFVYSRYRESSKKVVDKIFDTVYCLFKKWLNTAVKIRDHTIL